MASKFSVEAVFKAVDRVTAPINRMQNRVGKFTRGMQRGLRTVNRQVDKLGRGLKTASVVGAASLVLVGSAMADVIKTGAEFEQTLVAAAAKFPEDIRKGTEAFKELEEVARKTGATTEFTAAQAASGLNFLAMAGFNAKQSIAALPGVVDLATAAGTDLAKAADVATDTLGAFGLAVEDPIQLAKNMTRVNDVLAVTLKRANTDMELFFETIKKGGPQARASGASFETMAALSGIMANSSLKASEAGSTLKNMFLRLSAPVPAAAKLIKQLGVRTQDSEGNLRDMVDILRDFEKGLKGAGTAQRAQALDLIFGKRAITGVNILLETGTDKLIKFRDELRASGGAASNMAGIIRDTLQGRINSMTSVIEGLKISLFGLKSAGIGGAVEGITNFARALDGAIKANGTLVTQLIDGLMQAGEGILGIFGLLVAKFLILKSIMIALTVTTKAWSAAMLAFKIVLGAISLLMKVGPIGAILTLITLGALLIANWDDIVAAISSAVNKIKPLLEVLASPFKDLFSGFSSVLGAARNLFGGGDGETAAAAGGATPQVVSPQARVAKTIEESRQTSAAELTIKDETGRGQLTQKGKTPGVGIRLAESGAF